MDNTFTLVKRGFSAAIAAATILWAVGVAAFAVPTQAFAATGGDLITGESLSTVYYMGYDGSRYTFTGEAVYETWFDGFGMVDTISDASLAAIDLGGNVVYRAGSRWIKVQSVSDTYAVSTNGMIHHIESEAIATDYAGSDWNTQIDDVPDVFFVDYSVGTSLMSATAFDGMMYTDGGVNMLAWGGDARTVSAAGATANYMEDRFFLDGAGIDATSLAAGTDVTGMECALTDAAQTGCTDAAVAAGDVTISASTSTPAGVTLPVGANGVEVFAFDVSAGAEDANVNIIALTMNGIGATSNIDNVYLYEGNTRLTESRSVNASTRQATFGSLNLDVAAGTTRTFTVRIEVATGAAAGDEIAFSIASADDVTTEGGAVSGPPVNGNSFTIAATSAGDIVVTKNGTISDSSLGEQDATVAQFKILANTEDAWVNEMTLKIDNAVDHSDFKLWDGATLLATGDYIGDKLVMFDLSADPFLITEGNSDIFNVTMDIGGEAADTIGVYVDNSVDILALGGDFGFGMSVDIASSGTYDGTTCTSAAGNCSYSAIQGGDVTITMNGPSAGDIRVNSQDQVLMDFSITSAQAITIKDLDIIVHGDDDADNDPFVDDDNSTSDDEGLINSGSEANIKDIKIVNADTGSVVMGPLELDCTVDAACSATGSSAWGDNFQTIDFTDDFSMVAGETLNLQVVVDVDNNVTSGTEFGATIDMTGFSAEDSNGDALTNATDVVPSSDLAGFAQEANAATMVVSLASTPGDSTAVQGKNGHEVNAFNFVTGDAGDVIISSITLSAYADANGTGTFTFGDVATADVNDFLSSCSLYDNAGNLIDGPTSPEADGTNIIFSDADWIIPASTTERLSVTCNLGNPTEASNRFFALDIADVSEDIVSEDSDGTDVDPTGDAVNNGTAVETTSGSILTIAPSGTIVATVDSSSPSADFVTTGSNDNLLGVFRFTATNEDFVVDKLTVTEAAGEIADGVTDSSIYTNNVSGLTLEYTNSLGSTVTSSSSFAGNEAAFSGLDIAVIYGDAALVNVYVDVPSTDRSGGSATSNAFLQLGVSGDAAEFNAVGQDSGVVDTAADALTTGDSFVVKETFPTVSLNGSSPSGTGFVPGLQDAFRFDVAANGNEDVIIDELIFNMASTDAAAVPTGWNEADTLTTSDFSIYNLSTDANTELDVNGDWAFLSSTGAVTTAAVDVEWVTLALTTPETIPAGTTYTFSLEFDSTGASAANDDSVQFSLESDPITGTFIALGTARTVSGAHTITATTLTASGALNTTSSSAVSAGDILAVGTERMLVTAYTPAASTATVVRGYLGTAPAALTGGEAITRLPGAFSWQDDGDNASGDAGDNWGAYLVDSLSVTGGSMGF